ncbi:hypothetical protein CLV24_105167 [Pontibacter ummariensis]|uniref:Porin n=1 Tax=Pontibacter ummariensis TaxID=1610492 RepID=A0A239DTF7_9BACT|nr:hypothetical protein [Pontibacter ummariensis]PRY13797.1 hypothetical protein CLV24_105167 [Pontibacter ummariensis]SNS34854.1 hypothetical protein SAMN06296052_10585 [Pontibacter ummariensis]
MKTTITFLCFLATAVLMLPATAQHQGHQQQPKDTATHQMGQQDHSQHTAVQHGEMQMPMSHAFSRNLPMSRNASGTGWLPDESPMYGNMFHRGNWMLMLHYSLFLRYNKQDVFEAGERGDSQFDAPNWFMLMGQRFVGNRGLLRFSGMISLDPITVGGNGYPLLFQTGETFEGSPLIDRQHPHDLFSELSVGYTHMLSEEADVFVYLGYPGEPALSNVAFMHRPSALNNPDSPLGHHWQDATHITFGVATLGVRYRNFKLEGSTFTGREPDEERYDFDKPRFDSRAVRLTYNPSTNWSLQASTAFVKSPEVAEPDENVYRTTASVLYGNMLGDNNRYFTASANWGYNYVDAHHKEHSFLLESNLQNDRFAIYGRYEFVQKSAEELGFEEGAFGHDEVFGVSALTVGANRQLIEIGTVNVHLGAQVSLFRAGSQLHPYYGELPVSGQVYLRFFPRVMVPRP